MPIPVEKLRQAQRPLKERIHSFLGSNPEAAYSLHEIVAGVEGYDAALMLTTFFLASATGQEKEQLLGPYKTALDSLLQDGKVEKAEYQGDIYYAVKKLGLGQGVLGDIRSK